MQGGVSGRELLYELFNLMGLFVPVRSWVVVWIKECFCQVLYNDCNAMDKRRKSSFGPWAGRVVRYASAQLGTCSTSPRFFNGWFNSDTTQGCMPAGRDHGICGVSRRKRCSACSVTGQGCCPGECSGESTLLNSEGNNRKQE